MLLDSDGRPMLVELRKTLRSANSSLAALETTLNNANLPLKASRLGVSVPYRRIFERLEKAGIVTNSVNGFGSAGKIEASGCPDLLIRSEKSSGPTRQRQTPRRRRD